MTRKKCIKILMNTVAESRYREAADLFTRSREAAQQVHVNVSNKELLGRLLGCAIRAGANYGEVGIAGPRLLLACMVKQQGSRKA